MSLALTTIFSRAEVFLRVTKPLVQDLYAFC